MAKLMTTSVKDLATTEEKLFRAIQEFHFLKEKRIIVQKGIDEPEAASEMSKQDSPLFAHNPFIGDDGLLRVGSRLIHADIEEDAKFPVILPKKDRNVDDLVRQTHEDEKHGGAKHVLCQLRQRVWILQGLQAVKSTINRCVKCQRMKKKACSQRMAPLPESRVSTTAPFSSCGIDIMGHFLVKLNGRANHKVYVAVFTCFESRAVHAEVVFKLDADSAINAIMRFRARRPALQKMFSDRGTNFVAANSILNNELQSLNEALGPELLKKGLEWEFNPAHAPHRGGVWERVVSLFKKHLTTAISGDVPTYDTFNTTIVEIESILNRRPITQISTDSKDVEALTPNHLLCPASIGMKQIHMGTADPNDPGGLRSSWKRAQNRINQFWKAFKRDYLSLLHSRPKWRRSRENLAVDDLVIIVNETVARHDWKMGRISKTFSSGPHVRRVEICSKNGKTVLRDRTKIVRLEMDE